jgi:RecA/RadA recombinase
MSKDTKDLVAAFGRFNDSLEKSTKSRVNLMGFSDISEYIHTGNYLLNALLSGSLRGGYPNARSTGWGGDPGTGKTFLAMNGVRNAQAMGYGVHYIDTEGALDSSDFEHFGINMDLLDYKRIGIISEVKFYINDIIKQIKANPGIKHMVVVDSLTQLETNKEVEDINKGNNAQDMGLRAKELRQLFKSFTLELSNLKVPMIFTSHTYAGQDQYAGKTISGGGGPLYSASIVGILTKGHLKADDDTSTEETGQTKTGVIVRIETSKNRLAKPHKIEIHISFHKGMNPYIGLQDFIGWDECGIGRGNKLTEKEFEKLKGAEAESCKPFVVNGETFYFRPKESARSYINKWNGEVIPWREIFTNKIFTDTVIDALDENVIKPMFKYSSLNQIEKDELDDLGGYMTEGEDDSEN